MADMKFDGVKVEEMEKVSFEMLKKFSDVNVIQLKGNLGAGKTTLTQHLLRNLGVEGPVSSPTFSIVNQYETSLGEAVYHLDCYRLKSMEEGLDIGLDEIFDSGNLCLIEWPEIIKDLILSPYLEVEIEHEVNSTRNITINYIES